MHARFFWTTFFNSISLRFHSDFTLISFRCHFDLTPSSLRSHFDVTSISLRFHLDATLSRHACARGDVWAHIGFSQLSAREGPTQESKAATRTCQKSNQGWPGQGHDPNPKQTLAVLNRSASSIGPSTSCPEFMGFMKEHEPGAGGTQKSAPLPKLWRCPTRLPMPKRGQNKKQIR